MSVTIRGLPQLRRRLQAIDDNRALLQRLQLGTVREAKYLVPRKTGNLGRSIAPGSLTDRDAFVVARAAYARWVEEGTRPHVIRPRNAQALRFPAAGTRTSLGGRVLRGESRRLGSGAYAFAKQVNHPGTKAQPFMVPGAKKAVEKDGVDVIVGLWNKAA